MSIRNAIVVIVVCLFSSFAVAQENCSTIVNEAINLAAQSCYGLGINEVCYGNVLLDVEPAPGVSNLVFNTQGDRTSVANISSMRLSSQLDSTGEWGIALMKVGAAQENTIAGQGVTVVLFGQVALVRDTQPGYAPMQAFTIVPGVVQPLCSGASPNGILIQTPRGVGRITMQVNGVQISLGSSAFIQVDSATSTMSIALLEGASTVSVGGISQELTAGLLTNIPVAADGTAIGAPSVPLPFDMAWFAGIPLMLLPDMVIPSLPVSDPDEIPIELVSGTYLVENWGCTTSGDGIWRNYLAQTWHEEVSYDNGVISTQYSTWTPDQKIGSNLYLGRNSVATLTITSSTSMIHRGVKPIEYPECFLYQVYTLQ